MNTPKFRIKGKTIAITGSDADHSRADVQHAIVTLGGNCKGSVCSKTDLVLFGERAGSKLDRAEQLKIDVLPIHTFMELYAAGDLNPVEERSSSPNPVFAMPYGKETPNFMYHFKTTIMVDLSLGDSNMALKRDTPNPQYQRVLHCHGFINIDEQPLNNDQVAAFEHCIMERARGVAMEQFGLERVIVEKAVIIIDSINLIGSNQ